MLSLCTKTLALKVSEHYVHRASRVILEAVDIDALFAHLKEHNFVDLWHYHIDSLNFPVTAKAAVKMLKHCGFTVDYQRSA